MNVDFRKVLKGTKVERYLKYRTLIKRLDGTLDSLDDALATEEVQRLMKEISSLGVELLDVIKIKAGNLKVVKEIKKRGE